jgi:hypothetical protein
MVAMTIIHDLGGKECRSNALDGDAAMKSETLAQRYRREAEECKLNAQRAIRPIDRDAWLKLAADWMKLAESAELNPMLDSLRH